MKTDFAERQDQDKSDLIPSNFDYQDGIAESGDYLPWGILASWDGNDLSLMGDFATDKYAFVKHGLMTSTAMEPILLERLRRKRMDLVLSVLPLVQR